MLVSQSDVRNRIDQMRLSCEGYKRQLRAPNITNERRERLESEVGLMEEEIAALEKIAQLGRVEEKREKIETIVRDRLGVLKERLAQNSATANLQPDEYEYASGEVKALMWVLGEDRLSQGMSQAAPMLQAAQDDPALFNNTLAAMLVRALREGREKDTRAGAAYDIGRLHIASALPYLVAALNDHPQVAAIARQALLAFSDEERRDAGIVLPAP